MVVDYVDGGYNGGSGIDTAIGGEHDDRGVCVEELSGEERHCGDVFR